MKNRDNVKYFLVGGAALAAWYFYRLNNAAMYGLAFGQPKMKFTGGKLLIDQPVTNVAAATVPLDGFNGYIDVRGINFGQAIVPAQSDLKRGETVVMNIVVNPNWVSLLPFGVQLYNAIIGGDIKTFITALKPTLKGKAFSRGFTIDINTPLV